MLDNAFIILFRPLLLAGLTARGLTTVQVKQNYQPTQQGRADGPAIYFNKIFDHRYGSPRVEETWNATTGLKSRTTTQVVLSTWQFGAITNQDPSNDTELTAEDILKYAASAMQDEDFQAGLVAQGVNISRISDIRIVRVKNDRDQFESNPTFDAIINHTDVFVSNVPIVSNFNAVFTGI